MNRAVKFILWALTGLTVLVSLLLWLLGVFTAPDDATAFWKFINDNGLINLTSCLILLTLGTYLFLQEISYRKSANRHSKISQSFRKRLYSRFFSPITWTDYEHILSHSSIYFGATKNLKFLENHPDILQRQVTRIESFRLKGIAKKRITVKRCYIQSLITGEKVNAQIGKYPAEDLTIEKNHTFEIVCPFKSPDNLRSEDFRAGYPLSYFRSSFREFRFVFEADRLSYSEDFGPEEIDYILYLLTTGLIWPGPQPRNQILPS